MTRVRLKDLEVAESILRGLGLRETAAVVAKVRSKVRQRLMIEWSEMQAFLDTLEKESKALPDSTPYYTFVAMQGIIVEALDATKARTRAELKKRALESPSVDAIIEQLHSGLPRIHEEIRSTTPPATAALLLMLGHVVRWQVMEDFAVSWVGHWGKGLGEERKREAIDALLTVKFAKKATGVLMSDTQMYRNAIAHGGFSFLSHGMIGFWTRDSKGVRHDLPPLNVADLAGLYNMAEKRLRTMEGTARVLRAWGRHGA